MHSYMFLQIDESNIPTNLIGSHLQPGTDRFCIRIWTRKVPMNELLNNDAYDLLHGNSVVSSVYLMDRNKLLSPVEGPTILSRLLKDAGVPVRSTVMRRLIRGMVEHARDLVERIEGREEPEGGKVYQPVLPIGLGIVEGQNNDHRPPLYSGQPRWSNRIRRGRRRIRY